MAHINRHLDRAKTDLKAFFQEELSHNAASGISHRPAHQKLMVMACHVGCQIRHALLLQQLQTHTWNSLLSVHLGCRIF